MRKPGASVNFVLRDVPALGAGPAIVFLLFFVFFAPPSLLHDKVALLIISPGDKAEANSMPSIFLGPLGSCMKATGNSPISCTGLSASPKYDVSFLPGIAPRILLTAPHSATAIILAVALGMTVIFVLMFAYIGYRDSNTFPRFFGAHVGTSKRKFLSAWSRLAEQLLIFLGLASFVIGFALFLIYRMWFGKTVKDFNAILEENGYRDILVAQTGPSAFAMIYTAYAFMGTIVAITVAKYGENNWTAQERGKGNIRAGNKKNPTNAPVVNANGSYPY